MSQDNNGVETRITLDGEPCYFVTMELDQKMSGHHEFEIVVSYLLKKQSVWSETVDDVIRNTLGKRVFIVMEHSDSGEKNEFHGVVTDIDVVGVSGDEGTVVLKGGSPTILLDRDRTMASFVDYSLHTIVKETIGNTEIRVEIDNNLKSDDVIPYVARYKESSWAFLSRVLYSYGEWFYYDGQKLVVGNPQNANDRWVAFDIEMLEIHSSASLNNLNTIYYEYDPLDNSYYEGKSDNANNGSFPMRGAKQIADKLYPTASKLPVGRAVFNGRDMESYSCQTEPRICEDGGFYGQMQYLRGEDR
jgi:hypothetical protein